MKVILLTSLSPHSHNIAADPSYHITELLADSSKLPNACYSKGLVNHVFNPVIECYLPHFIGGYDIAIGDISKGKEILDNYLTSIETFNKGTRSGSRDWNHM